MTDALKQIWDKVDQMTGPQRVETEAEHIARDMREGRFPRRSDPIQVAVNHLEGPPMTEKYGNRNVSKMFAQINALRSAIRAEGTEAIQAAWDAVEEHIDYA